MKTLSSVIFLDVDGVLNSQNWNKEHEKEIREGLLIDSEKVELLGQLVAQTGAKLVLHSGWRFWFDENLQPVRREAQYLQELLRNQKMKIYSVTPDFSTEEIRRTKKFSLVKAREIHVWLGAHKETAVWIVLDDLDLHDGEIVRRQIKTDGRLGLTKKDVEKARQILLKLPGLI